MQIVFGCGQGDWLEPLEGIIPIWCCDGYADMTALRVNQSNFRKIDIGTVKPSTLDVGPRDVVMSLEAMEHVCNVHEGNFWDYTYCYKWSNSGILYGNIHYRNKHFRRLY
jgi:hypothetical protein